MCMHIPSKRAYRTDTTRFDSANGIGHTQSKRINHGADEVIYNSAGNATSPTTDKVKVNALEKDIQRLDVDRRKF